MPMPISTSDMRYIITLFAIMVGAYTVIMGFGIAWMFYRRKGEGQCPSCGRYWARQDVGKELVDTYWKRFSLLTFFAWGRYLARGRHLALIGRIYKHKKYKLYH